VRGQNHFDEPNWHVLTFVDRVLICRVTYWEHWWSCCKSKFITFVTKPTNVMIVSTTIVQGQLQHMSVKQWIQIWRFHVEKYSIPDYSEDSQLSFTKYCSLNSYFLKFPIFLQIIFTVWKMPRYYKTLDARLAVQKGNKGCFWKTLLIYAFTIYAMGCPKFEVWTNGPDCGCTRFLTKLGYTCLWLKFGAILLLFCLQATCS
jgi:hypothetical protein